MLNRIIENFDFVYNIILYFDFKIIYMNNKVYDDLKEYIWNVILLFFSVGKKFFEVFKYNMDEKVKVISNIKYLIEKNGSYYFLNRKYVVDGEEKFFKVIF